MLKYKMLATDAISDKIETPVEAYETVDLSRTYFHKKKCYFVIENTENVTKNENILVLHKILVQNGLIQNLKEIDGDGNKVYYDPVNDYDEFVGAKAKYDSLSATDSLSKYTFEENLTVLDTTTDYDTITERFSNAETNSLMFTALTDRFFRLTVVKVAYISDDTIYITFRNSHFYNPNDKNVSLWLHLTENGEELNVKVECKYVNSTTLKIESFDNIEVYTNSGDDSTIDAGVIRELLKSDTMWTTIVFMRETPFYVKDENNVKLDNFTLYTTNIKRHIVFGLSKSDDISLMQSDSINAFISETKKNSINNITEMEKDIYHPVIMDGDGNISDANEIKFNLHFREHRGENWLVEPDSHWNGTIKKNGKLHLMTDNIDGACFYNDRTKTDTQSDLLSYLNFTDDDVKYRKSKLKKSFLRLSFYDSTNPADQNLLAYSTIFVDTGNLFDSYLKYGGFSSTNATTDNGDYMSLSYNGDTIKGRTKLKGIRVDREYNGNKDNVEKRRLSSQFVVKGRDLSDSSSEGYYLYLWKDNDGGIVPTNIYMKVEFNHAGYGRTIPFIMPYWDKNTTDKEGIKTFQDIVDDWNNTNKSHYNIRRDTRYTVQDYMKYSYIKLKYRYDKENERHIYYLDDTVYGDTVHFTDNAITLNLYEVKVI